MRVSKAPTPAPRPGGSIDAINIIWRSDVLTVPTISVNEAPKVKP
jgi:hypothetical protein